MSFIKGKFTKTIFYNETNGYYVGLLKVKECSPDLEYQKKTINFVGNFHELIEDATYIMHGESTTHIKYGEQFQVNNYELIKPEQKEEIITFLSSSLFPIGESTAQKIYDLLGNDYINKILENKDILKQIKRLSLKKIDIIYNVLKEYEYSSKIIINLNELGFTFKESLDIYNKYKENSLKIINENIYELITSLEIPFLKIDKIAKNLNIDEMDEKRLYALSIYIISKLTFEKGDTYLFLEEIYINFNKITKISLEDLEYILIKLNQKGKIIIEKEKYYLKEVYENEEYIADKLTFLNNIKTKKINIDKYLEKLQKKTNIIYDEYQTKAIKKAINNNVTIITGGPGTGKTTIIKAIVNILINFQKVKEENIALLAPTGRASKRIQESTNLKAMTIHRFLKWDKESNTFAINEYNYSFCDYIIVDEVSMIDNTLMASLLKGLKENVKIIFVGDYHQLPSVKEGQVLKDLIDSNIFDVIKLKSLYRQSENSYIVTLADEVKNKNLSDFYNKKEDYNFIETESENVNRIIENIIKKAIEKNYNDLNIQVLAPMYKGVNGITNLNKILQDKFNKKDIRKKELEVGEVIYRQGDKILQLVNDIDNNIFNGDIGFIEKILTSKESKSKKNEIHINYDGNIVVYTPSKFKDITHGYAISIHKAQGSEFDIVIIPVVRSYSYMLYNKLIYTAITRAKNNLLIIGDKSSFIYAVKNDIIENRKTSLKEKLINKYKK